jgi:hypothetical protein
MRQSTVSIVINELIVQCVTVSNRVVIMLGWCDYAQPADETRTVAEAAGSLIALHQQHSLIDVPQGQAHSVQLGQRSAQYLQILVPYI